MFGPFGDYSRYRRQMLAFCYAVWVPAFLAVSFVVKPEFYWLALTFAVVGATAFFFGLKSPFAAYLPLIIENSYELHEKLGALEYKKRSVDIPYGDQLQMGSIELPEVPEHEECSIGAEKVLESSESLGAEQRKLEGGGRDFGVYGRSGSMSSTPFLDGPDSASANEELSLRSDVPLSDHQDGSIKTLEERYQAAYQTIAGKIALRESASFISGMVLQQKQECYLYNYLLLAICT